MSDKQDKQAKMVRSTVPQEMPAVRMTIVGGRPPGCGKEIGEIPRGVEVLVKKAHVDAAFRAMLLSRRAEAAEAIGLALDPAEAALLNLIPAAQLEAVIAQAKVEPSKVPAFLGKAAAVMLVALGASVASAQVAVAKGVRPKPPVATKPADSQPAQLLKPGMVKAGIMVAPAAGARPPEQIGPVRGIRIDPNDPAYVQRNMRTLVRLLDSQDLRQSIDAQRKLLAMGKDSVPQMQEMIQQGRCSAGAAVTLQEIIDALVPPATQPTGPGFREVRTLLSQMEFGDDKAIEGAMKKLREMGKPIMPHLKQSQAEDKWKEAMVERIKTLMAELSRLPDPPPATQPADPKVAAIDGVPAELTDLVAALDARDYRARLDAQVKLLEKGAASQEPLKKVQKEGKLTPGMQTRLEQVMRALSQRPDQIRVTRGLRVGVEAEPRVIQPVPPAPPAKK